MAQVTLVDWLVEKIDDAEYIGLRDRWETWNIWDLLLFVRKCMAIPQLPFGHTLRNTHVYELTIADSRWLISEEDGRRLYEIVVATPRRR